MEAAVCINDKISSSSKIKKNGLTLGKTYQIEEKECESKFFTIINDNGNKVPFYKKRFKTRIEIAKERLKNL
jgi:hypothetical protein